MRTDSHGARAYTDEELVLLQSNMDFNLLPLLGWSTAEVQLRVQHEETRKGQTIWRIRVGSTTQQLLYALVQRDCSMALESLSQLKELLQVARVLAPDIVGKQAGVLPEEPSDDTSTATVPPDAVYPAIVDDSGPKENSSSYLPWSQSVDSGGDRDFDRWLWTATYGILSLCVQWCRFKSKSASKTNQASMEEKASYRTQASQVLTALDQLESRLCLADTKQRHFPLPMATLSTSVEASSSHIGVTDSAGESKDANSSRKKNNSARKGKTVSKSMNTEADKWLGPLRPRWVRQVSAVRLTLGNYCMLLVMLILPELPSVVSSEKSHATSSKKKKKNKAGAAASEGSGLDIENSDSERVLPNCLRITFQRLATFIGKLSSAAISKQNNCCKCAMP